MTIELGVQELDAGAVEFAQGGVEPITPRSTER
jgi:hypothetical protein